MPQKRNGDMPEGRNGDVDALRRKFEEFLKTRRRDGKEYAREILRAVATVQTLTPVIRDDREWVPQRLIYAGVVEDVPHKKTVHRILQDLVRCGVLEEGFDDMPGVVPIKSRRLYRVPLEDPVAIVLTPGERQFYVLALKERERADRNGIERNIALDMLKERGVVFPENEMHRRYAKMKRLPMRGNGLAAFVLGVGGPGMVGGLEQKEKTRVCKQCGADIRDKNTSAVFCSSACRQAYYRQRKRG